jgi:hypothetical protein
MSASDKQVCYRYAHLQNLTYYKFDQVVSPTNAAPIPTGRISASEGGIRRNGLTYRVTCPPSVASTRSEPGLDKVPDTNNDGFSDGNSCFPPESTTDSESNGMVVGEVDDDEDFVMEQNKSDASEKKMEAMLPSCTKKGKLVPKVTSLSRYTFPRLHIFSRLLAEPFVFKFKVNVRKLLLPVQW